MQRLVIGPEKIAEHVVASVERGRGETTVPRYYARRERRAGACPEPAGARPGPLRPPPSRIDAIVAAITTSDVVAVAEFRAALRRFLRRTERIARQSGLTPQRYLLLLMVKGAPTAASSRPSPSSPSGFSSRRAP